MMNNEFQDELLENIVEVGKLFEEVNMDTLEPKAAELITRLMLFQSQNNLIASTLEAQAKETNLNIMNDSYLISSFIEGKGLVDEFTAFAKDKESSFKLIDGNQFAEDSFQRGMYDPVSAEVKEASSKVTKLYNALESTVPKSLQNILWDVNEAYSDYLAISTEKAYFKGFHNALKAQGGQAQHKEATI